jgi:hypothetical protein
VTGDLAVWLRAQLDADEQTARAATPGPWEPEWDEVVAPDLYDHLGDTRFVVAETCGPDTLAEARHIARHDPAFTLADITAKRAIIDRHRAVESNYADYPVCAECSHLDHEEEPFPCATLCLLAQPYAGRPGWHNEWTMPL